MSPTLFFDGASKGNPGPSGAGAVLVLEDGERVPLSVPLEFVATNNVAEYAGLIEGLKAAMRRGVTHIDVRGDSELVIRQMTGTYRVKEPWLRVLHTEATRLAKHVASITYEPVPRGANREADAQATRAAERAAEMRDELTPFEEWKASVTGTRPRS